MNLSTILLDEKIIAAGIVGTATLIVKFVVSPLIKWIIGHVKHVRDLLMQLEEITKELKPNGGSSIWDKIDKTHKTVNTLHDDHTAILHFFQAVASTVPKIMITLNSKGEVTWVNERWIELTAVSNDSAEGYGWLNGVHADDREWVEAAWRSALSTARPFNEAFRLQHDASDAVTFVKTKAQPIFTPATSRLIGWVMLMNEIPIRQAHAA